MASSTHRRMVWRVVLYGALATLLVHYCVAAWRTSGPYNGFEVGNITVPLEQLKRGGPPRDGIPAIDAPRMVAAAAAGHLDDDDRILGLTTHTGPRAYPVRILNWHEIVNDHVGDQPLLVTWCPLCGSGVVFRPPDGSGGFGVSGLLYQSDLVLYDRASESLWSQISGRALSGPRAGETLQPLPVEHTTWGDWRRRHPGTLVLSDETGFSRDYRHDPYARYATGDSLMFDVARLDLRYPPKTPVIGLRLEGKTKVWPFPELANSALPVRDRLAGRELWVYFDADHRNAWVETAHGERLPALPAFWFAWMAFHPASAVYRAPDASIVAPATGD